MRLSRALPATALLLFALACGGGGGKAGPAPAADPRAAAWTTPTSLGSLATSGTRDFRLSLPGGHHPALAWMDAGTLSAHGRVHLREFRQGAWGAELVTPFSGRQDIDGLTPVVEVGGDLTLLACQHAGPDSGGMDQPFQLVTARRSLDTWGPLTVLPLPVALGHYGDPPAFGVALDGVGRLRLAWTAQTSPGTWQLWTGLQVGGAWTTELVRESSTSLELPQITANLDGSAFLLWRENGKDTLARLADGAWSAPLTPDFSSGYNPIVLVSRGATHADLIRTTQADGVVRVYPTDGLSVGAPVALNAGTLSTDNFLKVAQAPDGTLAVAWGNSNGHQIQARLRIGGAWAPLRTVSSASVLDIGGILAASRDRVLLVHRQILDSGPEAVLATECLGGTWGSTSQRGSSQAIFGMALGTDAAGDWVVCWDAFASGGSSNSEALTAAVGLAPAP